MSVWTEEKTKLMLELTAAGVSARRIAARIGVEYNQVICKRHYMRNRGKLPALRSNFKIDNYRESCRKPEPERPIVISTRRCLRCQHDFVSEGIHNRMCENCRDTSNAGLLAVY